MFLASLWAFIMLVPIHRGTAGISWVSFPSLPNGRSGPIRKKNFFPKDVRGGKEETLEDLMQLYNFSESQFRTWNDMITGKPILNHTYVVSFTPHIIEKLHDLKNLHNHSITGVVRNEKLGYLVTSALDLEMKVWNMTLWLPRYVKGSVMSIKPISALVPPQHRASNIPGGMDFTIYGVCTLLKQECLK